MSTKKRPQASTAELRSDSQIQGPETPAQMAQQPPEATVELKDVVDAILSSLAADPPEKSAEKRSELVKKYLKQKFSGRKGCENFNILVLHDEGRMVKSDADNIYTAATSFKEKKSLLLVLYSTGGVIGSAYLIGKLCREYSNGRFVVVVPRQAKSAATLICCAADEIHMGSLSELGPIDPQIEGLPALGLKSSVEHIASLVKECPESANMFAKYLHLSLEPIHLGYYERVAESAMQYAERLLKTHKNALPKKPSDIAKELVYSYKDHGFVIDKAEAKQIFGDKVVIENSEQYAFGNALYSELMFFSRLADIGNHYFYLIGSFDSDPRFVQRQPKK